MLIALLIVAVLAAVAFLALYLMTKGSAAEYRAQAEQREAELIAQRDDLTEAKARLETDLTSTRADLATTRTDLADRDRTVAAQKDELAQAAEEARLLGNQLTAMGKEKTSLEGQLAGKITELHARVNEVKAREATISVRDATIRAREATIKDHETTIGKHETDIKTKAAELDKNRAELKARAAEIESKKAEIGKLTTEKTSLRKRADEAEAAAATAIAANAGVVVNEALDLDGTQPEMLWQMELARSERTWRNSVATNPQADDSPFTDADDPVRLAVEIEAAALRENVGAYIGIDWKASPIEDPARRHLVVRIAQEMLEAGARSPEAAQLLVSDAEDGGVNLRLEPPADDEETVNIIPPHITNDLVDLREEIGPTITVKAAAT
ncbi:MAG: hypothetical protein ACK5PP_11430 [Acidimicrobiales bacterium]